MALTETVDIGRQESAAADAHYPPFEGPEKKLDVEFVPIEVLARGETRRLKAVGRQNSLRSLSRAEIDEILDAAACSVLSVISNASHDAFLLSESSLFVSDRRFMIKTCGTTTLLNALPILLRKARQLGLTFSTVQYSRSAFLFPDQQSTPHDSFENEARFLDECIGPMAAGVSLQVGSHATNLWHLYLANATTPDTRRSLRRPMAKHRASLPSRDDTLRPSQSVEVHMFDLDRTVMDQFIRDDSAEDASVLTQEDHDLACQRGRETTKGSGIAQLLPHGAVFDAYDFVPCGYSMNALHGPDDSGRSSYCTIHISPEPGASYVSFETSFNTSAVASVVAAVVKLFRPGRFSVAFVGNPGCAALPPESYSPVSWNELQSQLPGGFRTVGDPTVMQVGPRCFAAFASYGPTPRMHLDRVSSLDDMGTISDEDPEPVSWDCESETNTRTIESVVAGVHEQLVPMLKSNKDPVYHPPASLSTSSCDSGVEACVGEAQCGYTAGPDLPIMQAVTDWVNDGEDTEVPVFFIDLGAAERDVEVVRGILGPLVDLRYAVRCNTDPALLGVLDCLNLEFEAASLAEVDLLRSASVCDDRIVYMSPALTPQTLSKLGCLRAIVLWAGNVDEEMMKAVEETRIPVEIRIAAGFAKDAIAMCVRLIEAGCRVDAIALDAAPDDQALPPDEQLKYLESGLSTLMDVASNLPPETAERLTVVLGELYPGGRDGDISRLQATMDHISADFFRVTVNVSRFIVGQAAALLTTVIGRRCVVDSSHAGDAHAGEGASTEISYNYYLNDGVYGALSRFQFDQDASRRASPCILTRRAIPRLEDGCHGTLFGPTCDALDRIWSGHLPLLEEGDCVVFRGMGSYSASVVTQFNGFGRDIDVRYLYTPPDRSGRAVPRREARIERQVSPCSS